MTVVVADTGASGCVYIIPVEPAKIACVPADMRGKFLMAQILNDFPPWLPQQTHPVTTKCCCHFIYVCSVVASALGIPALLPFLKAVCLSKKSWQARHTGIKIVQQIAILMGCAVLPHLKALVDIIKHGLKDENQKVCRFQVLVEHRR